MVKHYFKLTLRNLKNSPVFTFINIGGLVVAMSCAFLILLFVINELSTDRFHKNVDNLYRVYVKFESEYIAPATSYILADNIKEKFPEIVNVTKTCDYTHHSGGQFIIDGNEEVETENFIITNQNFFNMFSFKLLKGNREKLITDLRSLVISERIAQKYFPEENPIGKTLKMKNYSGERTYVITGVIENPPSNSTLQIDFIGHIELNKDFYAARGWRISGTKTYISLKEGADVEQFVAKLNAYGEEVHPDNEYEYNLQSFKDIYFKSDFFSYNFEKQGNYKLLILLSVIGFLILLIACINYIIMSTAKSTERNIEIGLRKVIGANKSTIFFQMISESFIISLISFPLAIMLAEFCFPLVEHLLGKKLDLEYGANWPFLVGIFLITVLAGFLSGTYISVYVSSFSPQKVFKKQFTQKQSKIGFRKVLLSVQTTTFLVLFVFAIVVIKQLKYVEEKDTGFDTSNLLAIYPPHDHNMFNCKTYVDEIIKNPKVLKASEVCAGLFTSIYSERTFATDNNPEDEVDYKILSVDANYIDAINFEMIKGRGFDGDSFMDSSSIIINESAAKQFGGQNPIGAILNSPASNETFRVVGVVKDFHFQSLHNKIPPMGITLKMQNEIISQILVRIDKRDVKETIQYLEESWHNYGPYGRFIYDYVENKISDQYEQDRKFSDTIKIFTLIALIIASLGMFGFTFYSLKQRTKEIGIRKVLGASVGNIVSKVIKELLLLIVVSNIISWPIAYYISSNWLSNFAYQTSIAVWVFAVGIFAGFAIIIVTSWLSVYRAANMNPAISLKYE